MLERNAWRNAIAVCLAAGVVRVIIAATMPLFPDETYYWDWSRHLSFGYYDHPPMVAWITRIGPLIAGNTPLGVRLGAVAAGIVATLFASASARRLAGDREALIVAVIFAVMPLSAAGLILCTPDAPLLSAVAATIYCVIRALESEPATRASLRWWSLGGLALGCAFLSKYTSALIPLGVLVAMVVDPRLRRRFAEPGPYVAIAIALVLFSPVLLWNAQHDWVSIAFQLKHGFSAGFGSAWRRELEFIGGQAGLVSPVLFALAVAALWRGCRRTAPETHVMLASIAIVVVAFFVYSATHRRVEPNWPAPAYLPAMLLLSTHIEWRKSTAWGVALAALITVVMYVDAFAPILPVAAGRDPTSRAVGWAEVADSVSRTSRNGRTFFGAERYQEASELAFHLPGQPVTFAVNMIERDNQYDLWPEFHHVAQPGDALVIVVDEVGGEHPSPHMLAPYFAHVTMGRPILVRRRGDVIKSLRIWILDGWLGTWPQRALRSRT